GLGHNICQYQPDADLGPRTQPGRHRPASNRASTGPPGCPVLQCLLADVSRVRPLPAEAALAGPPRPGRRHPTYMGAGFALPMVARLLRRPARPSGRLTGGLVRLAFDFRLMARGLSIAALEFGVPPIDVSLRAIQRLAGVLDPLTRRADCVSGRFLRAQGIQTEARRPFPYSPL